MLDSTFLILILNLNLNLNLQTITPDIDTTTGPQSPVTHSCIAPEA